MSAMSVMCARSAPARAAGARLLLLAATLSLVATGCGRRGAPAAAATPPPVAGTEVAAFIDAKLDPELAPLAVTPARCPDRLVLAKEKPEFCGITVEGQPVRVRVVRADNGGYTVATDQAVVVVQKLEAALAAQTSQAAGVPVQVDCGDRAVLVADPPKTVQCLATPAGKPARLLDVTINDTSGAFSYTEHRGAGG